MRNIEGRNPVTEALKSKTKIKTVYIELATKDHPRIQAIIKAAEEKKIPVQELESLSKMAKTKRYQGVIAIAEGEYKVKLKDVIEASFDKPEKPLFIVLSGTVYEHNLGSVMRSADAAGADAVIVSQNSFGLSPVVTKSSAGASEHVTFIQDNLFNAIKQLRDSGIKIMALKEGQKSLFECRLDVPLAIIIGAEDKGVNSGFDKFIDETAGIPMRGKMSSLNMAVAASVAMFEANRQRYHK
jgi:23S rRNA (guanosine2251-2'-O)-methyltransferase